MTSTTAALLLAAAGVGLGHAILPDHWLPLAVLARTRRYPVARVARLSGLAGLAHVLVSIVLGAVVVVIGLQFRSHVRGAEDLIVGVILLATALGFVVAELTGHGHHHAHDHGHGHPDGTRHGHGHGHSHGHGHDHSHGHDHGYGHGDDDAARDHGHDAVRDHDDDDAARDHDPQSSGHPHQPSGSLSGLAAVVVPFGAAASPDLTILPVFLASAAAGAATAVASVVVFAAVTISAIVALTLLAHAGVLRVKGAWLERWGNLITAATLAVIGALVLTGVI